VVSWKPIGHVETERGTREGLVYTGEPEMAKAVSSYQNFLQDAASGVQPDDLLEELVQAADRNPRLVYEVPLWDNVLAVMGISPTARARLSNDAQRRLSTWLRGEYRPPEAINAADVYMNVFALCAAGLEAGRDQIEPGAELASERGDSLDQEDLARIDEVSRQTARPMRGA
jgi:hypothetical protein